MICALSCAELAALQAQPLRHLIALYVRTYIAIDIDTHAMIYEQEVKLSRLERAHRQTGRRFLGIAQSAHRVAALAPINILWPKIIATSTITLKHRSIHTYICSGSTGVASIYLSILSTQQTFRYFFQVRSVQRTAFNWETCSSHRSVQ